MKIEKKIEILKDIEKELTVSWCDYICNTKAYEEAESVHNSNILIDLDLVELNLLFQPTYRRSNRFLNQGRIKDPESDSWIAVYPHTIMYPTITVPKALNLLIQVIQEI